MTEQVLLVRRNLWHRVQNSAMYYSFIHNRTAMVSAAIVFTYVLLAVLAPLIAPYNPWDLTQFDIMDSEIPPIGSVEADSRFMLGTDAMG
ncbi:MAG: ABC transporter permease, partial [Gammaproteobacteria bacterium]|nr:ABC transporter permease [Gammaproteobacteria bacterium]